MAWIVAHKPETTSLMDGFVTAPAKQDATTSTGEEATKGDGNVLNAEPEKKSPADDIPADTGEAAAKPTVPATTTDTDKISDKTSDKASDIPE